MPVYRGTRLALLGRKRTYIDKVLSHGPIAYWPMNEPSGSVAHCLVNPLQDAAYAGVTLGQPGIGDGNMCPLFDGLNDLVDAYSTTFRDAFALTNTIGPPAVNEGTVMIWAKVFDADVWVDAARHYCLRFRVDANNELEIRKEATDNTVRYRHIAGGVAKSVNLTISNVGWVHLGLTWSSEDDEVIAYSGGVQTGATQTGLGTWDGLLSANYHCIGNSYTPTPAFLWYGHLAHPAIFPRALTPEEMADLAVV